MSTVTRSRRSRRPPLNRDQAIVPITQRQEENFNLDEPMEPITQPRRVSATNARSESSMGASIENGNASNPESLSVGVPIENGNALNPESAASSNAIAVCDSTAIEHRTDTRSMESALSGGNPLAADSVAGNTVRGPAPDVIDLTATDFDGPQCGGIDSDMPGSTGEESAILHSHPNESMGQESTDIAQYDTLYSKVTLPDQTDDQFQKLIAAANDRGVIYASPKGKEKEVQSRSLAMAANEEESVPITFKGKAAVSSPAFDYPMENSGSHQLSVLMVGVQCPDGRYSHAVFQVLTQSSPRSASALDLYESLRSSQDADAIVVNLDINDMDCRDIQLGTARLPIFMDELPNYLLRETGFRRLGFLQELEPNYLIKPVLDGEEKGHTLEIFGHDQTLDIYVLYIWTGQLNAHPSVPMVASTSLDVGTTTTSDNQILQRLLEQYQIHFQRLVLKKTGDDESAFAMVMFVRIVSEICDELHIPCRRGIAVHVKHAAGHGNGRISIADVVEGFKHGSKPYRSPYTFGNYRTIKLNAEALLDYMENECKEPDNRYVERARQLLETPLTDAVKLNAGRYGKIKDFELKVKALSIKHELVTPKEEEAREDDY
ncbi:hypothetical protein F5887DRAFT_1083261 [Amanita rubescens]|nr:hypothetical protein F5887DRAFT_1083261 [Amanita rubescens]